MGRKHRRQTLADDDALAHDPRGRWRRHLRQRLAGLHGKPAARLRGRHQPPRRKWSAKAGWNPQQALSAPEALHAYTVERGEIHGPSTTTGTLQPGQKADVVVLDPSVKLDDVRTWWPTTKVMTIVDGERVFLP